jgi:hypothetical protein
MTNHSIKIKELISGNVDMGTFGLIELELLSIEVKINDVLKYCVTQIGSATEDYEHDQKIHRFDEMYESGGKIEAYNDIINFLKQ